MAEVRGFRGVRYNPAVIKNFDDVITPPFDVISDVDRQGLAARSPYNYVHFILPEARDGLNKYESAARTMQQWIAEDVVIQDDAESFYLLEQRFHAPDGTAKKRRGFFAVIRLPEEGDGAVLGHERTFEAKFQDRLQLTVAVKANPGAVFLLYDDPDRALGPFLAQMDTRPPDLTAHTIDKVDVKLWRVPADPRVAEAFHQKTLYIADGHHRFRTACAYRDRMRAQGAGAGPYDFALMGFVAADDPGFLICPAHRLVTPPPEFELTAFLESLKPSFQIDPFNGDLAAATQDRGEGAFGLETNTGVQYLLTLKNVDRAELLGTDHGEAWRALDVSVLHRVILERHMGLDADAMLIYEHDPKRALERLHAGDAKLAFLINGVTPRQLFACADSGEFMPQKSTYIFPKLPSGAVHYRMG